MRTKLDAVVDLLFLAVVVFSLVWALPACDTVDAPPELADAAPVPDVEQLADADMTDAPLGRCGFLGLACCAQAPGCVSPLECNPLNGADQCTPCGGLGEPCCRNVEEHPSCSEGFTCVAPELHCVPVSP